MPGIYIAAILTIAFSLGIVVAVVIKGLPASDRLPAVFGVVGGAAAFFGAFYLLRVPLDQGLQLWLQGNPTLYRFITTFYAPVTEEPAKWLVLIPFFLMGKIDQKRKEAWAVCLGFGFGMGEIVFLAQNIAADPQALNIPWYLSSGFIVERLMICFVHSALVLIAAQAFIHRKFWGILVALFFHWQINFPIYLARQYPLDENGIIWGQLLWMWSTLFFIGALLYLGRRMLLSPERMASILGRAICPECQTLYVRPWWGINRIGKRYELCPQCKHYHWTTLYVEKPEK